MVRGFSDSRIPFTLCTHSARFSAPLSHGGNCHVFSDDDEGALVEKCGKCALRISERAERIIHSNVSRELILSSFCIPSNYHRERCVWRVAACRMQIPTTSLSRIYMCALWVMIVSHVYVCTCIRKHVNARALSLSLSLV